MGGCEERLLHAGRTPGVSQAPWRALACSGGLGSNWAEPRMCSFSAGRVRDVDVHLVCKLCILKAMSWSELCSFRENVVPTASGCVSGRESDVPECRGLQTAVCFYLNVFHVCHPSRGDCRTFKIQISSFFKSSVLTILVVLWWTVLLTETHHLMHGLFSFKKWRQISAHV